MIGSAVMLFALRQEAGAFLRATQVHEKLPGAPFRIHVCGQSQSPMLVMETGVGRERMQWALDWVLGQPLVGDAPYIPKLVISAGFSGALREDLRVGDIIVATEVIGPDGIAHAVSWPSDGAAWAVGHRRGRLLTVDRLIADPAEKRALALRHDALAVDMETATVGGRCSELGIPFACIRVISDDAHSALSPELDYFVSNGRVSLPRLAGSLLLRPRLAAELWRLARNTRMAAEQLGKALAELFAPAAP